MGLSQWFDHVRRGSGQPDIQLPSDSPAPLARRRMRFSGIVQGVGFRYEARMIASQLNLVGWVQNQGDGSVVLEIEGPGNYIEAFLLAVEAVPRFSISEIQSKNLPPAKTETTFKILY